MTFQISPNGTVIAPGEDTSYPIAVGGFRLQPATRRDAAGSPVSVDITNDYPKSDGIHLFSTATHSGQAFEFELFNPGGNMFDSTTQPHQPHVRTRVVREDGVVDVQDGYRCMSISLDSVIVRT